MSELNAGNEEVIAEFRATGGNVGGFYARESLLLLTTTGRKSGKSYTTPLSYEVDGNDLIVIGANLDSARVSDWYLNAVASPRVIVEVAGKQFKATATMLDGDRRNRLLARMQVAWNASRAISPELPELPLRDNGEVPVVALTPIEG